MASLASGLSGLRGRRIGPVGRLLDPDLIDDRVMINRALMTKFGICIGEVTLFFRKLTP